MMVSRANLFAIVIAIGYLVPLAIPSVGLEYQYFFIMVIVLFAWSLIKWGAVKAITSKSSLLEVILGVLIIAGDYAFNALRSSTVGILDLIVIFLAAVVISFGVKSLKLFWVPTAYGVVLLAGYQLESILPSYGGLQDWLAQVMAASMNAIGIGANVSGHQVSMNLANGTPAILDVSSACTGLQGILAFGLLSTMSLLDLKPRLSRIIPIFALGFVGAFLINIVRLLVVFLTFEYVGVDAGTTMHVYAGYLIFIAWVLAFWAIAFKYLIPSPKLATPQIFQTPSLTK